MSTVPVLRTERLVLRDWREQDRAPFAAMNADPVVMEHFVTPLTREQSDAFVDRIVARWQVQGFGLWAVEVDGAFAGYVGLARADFEASFTPAIEIGWRLDRPYWGRGIATEAARAGLAYGFDVVGLPEVDSWTAITNVRSWRVMERLGMVRDVEFEHPRCPVGHPVRPHVLYRLTRKRWEQTAPR
jgi:ribosomal-protein-alanine N-acetyltransferase